MSDTEDRNQITDEIISLASDARFGGKVWIDGLYSGAYRKPVFRYGAWYVRDHGWRKILSFQRLDKSPLGIRFSVKKFHIRASSRLITHDGGSRPAWLNDKLHIVYAETYKTKPGFWNDVDSFYVGARCMDDIPDEFRPTHQ